ncbi:hypothetical protein ACTXT7_013814 [Hymenolepis weldensis]
MPEVHQNAVKHNSYDLMNYQHTIDEDGKEVYKYVQIGGWRGGRLYTTDPDYIQFHNEFENASRPVDSFCSEPCGPWESKDLPLASRVTFIQLPIVCKTDCKWIA